MQKRVAHWLKGGVVLCVAGAGMLLLIPREQLLLTKAHKTALSAEHFGYGGEGWRSEHEQFILRHRENTDHFGVFARNIHTGKETPLEPFNTTSAALLKASKSSQGVQRLSNVSSGVMSRFMLPLNHAFSPDGRWLLWGDDKTCRIVSLSGKAAQQAANVQLQSRGDVKYRINYAYWLPDSRRWLTLVYDSDFYIHGVTLYSLDAPLSGEAKTFASRGSRWLMGITPDDHLLSYEPSIPLPSPALIYYDTPLNDPQPVSRKITIPLPTGTTIHSVALSPDGTRLLWSLRIKTRPPGPLWMQQLCAGFGMRSRTLRTLWISQRNGSDLREIGHIVENPPDLRGTPQQQQFQQMSAEFLSRDLYQIHWLPDSKRVLCAVDNAVYTVEVD